jgi:quercetin dioxygenase-like cupin family protein
MSSNHANSLSQPADALSKAYTSTELQRSPCSIPGREIVLVRTETETGAESGCHMHPGEEVGYILAGTVEMTVDQQPTLILRPGDPFLVPPRTSHNARNIGSGSGQVISIYIVDIWEPLAWSTD